MDTFDPIVHPSPITEFETLVSFPILVPHPITVNGPITADCVCEISERGEKTISNTLNKERKLSKN